MKGKRPQNYRRGILAIIKDVEKPFLSDETRLNLSIYDNVCTADFHNESNDLKEFSNRAVFFMMMGLNDDFLKSFFLPWLSASVPPDFIRAKLPMSLWRACLRVLLVHWVAPDRCPYVGYDTILIYSGLSKSVIWDSRDFLIKAGILKRSGWAGHYYIPKQHRRTLLKLFIEAERRFHSLTAEQLILKRDKAGPDWDEQ